MGGKSKVVHKRDRAKFDKVSVLGSRSSSSRRSSSSKGSSSKGVWVTMNGGHVFLEGEDKKK